MSLRTRLARGARSPRALFSASWSRASPCSCIWSSEGIKDVFDDAPVEVAFVVEPVLEQRGDKPARPAPGAGSSSAMYRAWAEKRHMQVSELPRPATTAPVLLVSGFGAHRVLAREAGLHVLELDRRNGAPAARRRGCAWRWRRSATCRPPSCRGALIEALRQGGTRPNGGRAALSRGAGPLVRNADGSWRTGKLDAVLRGDFDLLAAEGA